MNIEAILKGNRRALAKSITLIESKLEDHQQQAQQLLNQLLPYTGKSIRIGISGIPGVGKSTFIESFGLHLIQQGLSVAVLAVDPSSPMTGGSILGDKTRMEELSRETKAFIRPTPSAGSLGGVAQKTRETMLLCEASGYEVIIIETVGVGQSEFEVADMVDCFTLLLQPNTGDELQGIKKGILEIADLLIINKADGDALLQARKTQQQHQSALKLVQHNNFWTPPITLCSALKHENIDSVWNTIRQFESKSKQSGFWQKKRQQQNQKWFKSLINEMLENELKRHQGVKNQWKDLEDNVREEKITPFHAAQNIVSTFLNQ